MSQPDKVTFRAVESVHPNSMLIRDTDKLEFVDKCIIERWHIYMSDKM